MWSWLNENSGAIGVVFALVPLIWAAVEYIRKAREERKHLRFVNYHKLVEDLVDGEPGRVLKVDRQLAVIFELQKNREYRVPSRRILSGFRELAISQPTKHDRLIEQIDESISALR